MMNKRKIEACDPNYHTNTLHRLKHKSKIAKRLNNNCKIYSQKITVVIFALIFSNSAQKGFHAIRKKGLTPKKYSV